MELFLAGMQVPSERTFKIIKEMIFNPPPEITINPVLEKKTYEELEKELIETRTRFFENIDALMESKSTVFRLELELNHEKMSNRSKIKVLEAEVNTYKQLMEMYSDRCEKLEKRTLFDYLFR